MHQIERESSHDGTKVAGHHGQDEGRPSRDARARSHAVLRDGVDAIHLDIEKRQKDVWGKRWGVGKG